MLSVRRGSPDDRVREDSIDFINEFRNAFTIMMIQLRVARYACIRRHDNKK